MPYFEIETERSWVDILAIALWCDCHTGSGQGPTNLSCFCSFDVAGRGMSSEETPLLAAPQADNGIFDHATIYDRFTSRQKVTILAIVSWCGLMPLFISGSFVPLIPQIATELNSTGPIVSLAISLAMFASALGGLSGGSYSTYYGRKPVYLAGMILVVVGSLGVGFARSIPELMFWRFFQTFGASPGISVGAGVIGDVYRLEQRGTAMGVFLAAVLLGPTVAPLAGGLAAYYASWRAMQLILGLAGFIVFMTLYFIFPETSHPGSLGVYKTKVPGMKAYKFINPLRSLLLLRSPLLMSTSVATFLVLLTDFAMLTPMAYTLGKRYNIENEALLGLCFLPNGLGDIVGAPLAGRISDKLVVRYREQRGGVWYPEDRLRVTVFAAATLVPLSSLFFGLLHAYVGGTVGLVLNLVCLFMNGVGVQMVLGPTSAYLVDIMHSRSAETIAANNGFRSSLISLALAVTLPLIEWIGIAPAYAIFAILAWGGFGMLWMIVRHGDRLRDSNDIGFSNASNN